MDPEDSLAFRVFLATSRLVPGADPYSRQFMMSIGGFIAVFEDAAAQEAYALQIDLFPEGGLPENDGGKSFRLPVAEVRLRSSEGAAGFPSLDAISSATVKANLGRATLSDTQVSSFLELDDSEEIHVRFVQDEAELLDLKPILKEAFRLEMEYEPTLLESYDLTRRQHEAAPD